MSSTSAIAYRPPELNTGTVTSWIPLTTPHKTDDGCSTSFKIVDSTLYAWEPSYQMNIDLYYNCVPSPVMTWWNQWWVGINAETVLNIGPLVCPEPFTLARSSPLNAYSTQIACCPSGYQFWAWSERDNGHQCYSDVASGRTLTYQTTGGTNCSSWYAATLTTNETRFTVWAVQINGWIFAEETGAAGSYPASNTSSCSSSDGELDNGDKIGIGIGVGMGVIGLATLTAGLVMTRRARRSRRPPPKAPGLDVVTQPSSQTQETSWGPAIGPEIYNGHYAAAGTEFKCFGRHQPNFITHQPSFPARAGILKWAYRELEESSSGYGKKEGILEEEVTYALTLLW